eukprot:Lithocolla_globosa_v1_NODE_2851_length_1847_cov_17.476004.p1 type:complete len:556 gc:universal NODE_2851_length_1847_cov_17.476004:1736-69(-)
MTTRCRACGQRFDSQNSPVGVPLGKSCEPHHQGPFDPVEQTSGCLRACTLDEWYVWIKDKYYPRKDINQLWEALQQEQEFSDDIKDYPDALFKSGLEQVSERTGGVLKSFCDALLAGWERKLPTPNQPASASGSGPSVRVSYADILKKRGLPDSFTASIPAIPLPLSKNQFISERCPPSDMSVFGEIILDDGSSCEISKELWDALLSYSPFAASEAGHIDANNVFYKIPKAILECETYRDNSDISSFKRLRADVIMSQRTPIARFEEKDTSSKLTIACNELTSKMKTWNPVIYGNRSWILGVAVADATVQAYKITTQQDAVIKLPIGSPLNLRSATGRVAFIKILVNFASMILHDNLASVGCTLHLGKNETGNGNVIELFDDKLIKIYSEPKKHLAEFYELNVDGCEVGKLHVPSGKPQQYLMFEIFSLGIDREPENAEQAKKAIGDIARASSNMHLQKWCHLDIRWSNVVWDPIKQRWFLIDCEYALKFGSRIPKGLKIKDAASRTVRAECDYYLVGRLIRDSVHVVDDSDLKNQLCGDNIAQRKTAFQLVLKW